MVIVNVAPIVGIERKGLNSYCDFRAFDEFVDTLNNAKRLKNHTHHSLLSTQNLHHV
jgi:hypothetical protein